MLVDTMTTGSRRRHVTLFKQGIEENVERSTTDAPGNRGIARAEQGDHRDQAGKRGYYAVTRFPLPEPAFPPSQLAANFVVTRRNSPP